MDISNNTNISTQIANSISKLNLNTAKRPIEAQNNRENTSDALLHSAKKDDIQLKEALEYIENISKEETNADR